MLDGVLIGSVILELDRSSCLGSPTALQGVNEDLKFVALDGLYVLVEWKGSPDRAGYTRAGRDSPRTKNEAEIRVGKSHTIKPLPRRASSNDGQSRFVTYSAGKSYPKNTVYHFIQRRR